MCRLWNVRRRRRAGYPVEDQDVAAFVDYVVANAATHGVDPHRVVLRGGSAGAALAVDTATHPGSGRVAAAVGWSGGYSFTETPPMYLAHSTAELVPLPQLTDMTAALHTAGVEVRTQIIPGHQHATAHAALAYRPTVALLAARTGPITGTCTPPTPSGARR